jgi:methyl-accepting chemotaxis protein
MRMSTEGCLEKYVKTLIGKTEMEDALKRLDKLTQEEARMAAAQNLKATHTVDERVKGVADTVVAIDNRVAGVDDRVASVGDQVADVNDQVAGVSNQVSSVDDRVASVNDRVVIVDDRVKVVDDRVMEVIAGMQNIFSQSPKRYINIELLRRATNGQRCT